MKKDLVRRRARLLVDFREAMDLVRERRRMLGCDGSLDGERPLDRDAVWM